MHYIITKAKKLQINTKPQTYNTYMFILKKKKHSTGSYYYQVISIYYNTSGSYLKRQLGDLQYIKICDWFFTALNVNFSNLTNFCYNLTETKIIWGL